MNIKVNFRALRGEESFVAGRRLAATTFIRRFK
jgi:hypothetical protein